jgi:hypothetical protein
MTSQKNGISALGCSAFSVWAATERLMLRKLRQPEGEKLLPRVNLAVSLLKRWMLGTHQGSTAHKHLDDYLKEFVSRFSRRKSASRGKLCHGRSPQD